MKILGIDYGRKKMGVAVAESDEKLVQPIGIVANDQFSMTNFQKIINDQNIKKIVIGVPGGLVDNEIRNFGKKLEEEIRLPVKYFDETLTTQDAQEVLIESGGKRKKRKEKEDAIAAALMLQYYFEGGCKDV